MDPNGRTPLLGMHNPFDTPRPRGTRLLQGTLRVVVAMQCWGLAAARLHQGESVPVQELMVQVYNLSQSQAELVQNVVASFMIAAGGLTLFRPSWLVLIPVLLWQSLIAACAPLYGVEELAWLVPLESMARYVAPLALMMIDFWPPGLKTSLILTRSSTSLLLLAAVSTFLCHGFLLIDSGVLPEEFRRLLSYLERNVSAFQLENQYVPLAARVIGALEVAGAVCLITSRNRPAAFALVAWGFASTLLYALVHRSHGYHEALHMAGNWGAPLVVLLFWTYTIEEPPVRYLPEETAEEQADDAAQH